MARVLGHGVDCEEGEGDPGERRGEPVHVVEQVEGVRHADEPEHRDRARDDRVVHELHGRPGCEHDRAGGDLQRELGERVQVPEVVDQAGEEHHGDPGVHAEQLLGRVSRADRNRQPEPGGEAGEDAETAEKGRRGRVPAVGRGMRNEPARQGGTQERPDHERAGGEGDKRRDGAHGR